MSDTTRFPMPRYDAYQAMGDSIEKLIEARAILDLLDAQDNAEFGGTYHTSIAESWAREVDRLAATFEPDCAWCGGAGEDTYDGEGTAHFICGACRGTGKAQPAQPAPIASIDDEPIDTSIDADGNKIEWF
jgi:hypothetical protein